MKTDEKESYEKRIKRLFGLYSETESKDKDCEEAET